MSLYGDLHGELPILTYGLGGWRFLGVPTDDPHFILAVMLGFTERGLSLRWL